MSPAAPETAMPRRSRSRGVLSGTVEAPLPPRRESRGGSGGRISDRRSVRELVPRLGALVGHLAGLEQPLLLARAAGVEEDHEPPDEPGEGDPRRVVEGVVESDRMQPLDRLPEDPDQRRRRGDWDRP